MFLSTTHPSILFVYWQLEVILVLIFFLIYHFAWDIHWDIRGSWIRFEPRWQLNFWNVIDNVIKVEESVDLFYIIQIVFLFALNIFPLTNPLKKVFTKSLHQMHKHGYINEFEIVGEVKVEDSVFMVNVPSISYN